MQVRLFPPPFGRDCAADDTFSCNHESTGRPRRMPRSPGFFRVGFLSLLAAFVPLTSFGAVQLTGLSCSNSSFSGPGTETCTVTLSSVVTSARLIDLNTNSNAINVPDDATVASGQSTGTFTAPVAAVNSAQTVTITAKSGSVSKSFAVKLSPAGTTTAPGITVSASSVAFGTVTLNTTTTKTVTLTSSGTAALTISSASVAGTSFGDSGVGFPVTLNPGQSAVLTLSFDPTTAGSFSGSVTISSNASTATISLSGTGQAPVAPTLSALTCSSGSLTGAGTDACTVTLTSAATTATTVTLASSSTAGTVPVSVTIAAGATSAGFTATASAVSTNQTATVTATAGGVSKTFALTLNATTSALTLSSTSVAFGTDVLNTTTTKTVTLTSSGTVALTINSASVTGTGFGDSGMSFPISLNPGQAATLTISFDPTTAGTFSGVVTISSNATSGGTSTISLSGTGQAPATLSALSCSSGSLTGAGTDACTVTLTSAATSATTVTLASSSTAVTVPASVTIAAGATSASFTATESAVTSNQTATLTAMGGGIAKTFALTLNAPTPTLALGSSSVSFGTVDLNTPATQTVTMTSSGTGTVTVSAATVTGSGFTLPGAKFPMTLTAGQISTLEVQFDPAAAGAQTGTVALASNCSMGGTMMVALSGTGAAAANYEVELSWDAPASSSDPVSGYHVYRAASGGSFALLSSSVNIPTTYNDTTVQAGSTYNYEVTSVDASGVESTPSNVYTATIP